jgi:hypothetical protein
MRIHILIFAALLIMGCAPDNNEPAGTAYPSEKTSSSDLAGTCPRGYANDTYPGNCGLYLDDNINNICDRSE